MKVKDIIVSDDILDSAKEIRKDCSKFINSTQKSIYRGSNFPKIVGEIPIRMDRRPLAGKAGVSRANCFNLMIERKFGIERVRDISLFCTPYLDIAETFGRASHIFPKNDAKILVLEGTADSSSMGYHMFSMYTDALFGLKLHSDKLLKAKTLKEVGVILGREKYIQFESILDNIFNEVSDNVEFSVMTSSDFHSLDALLEDTEMMIFNSSSVWGIRAEEGKYPELLSMLKGTK